MFDNRMKKVEKHFGKIMKALGDEAHTEKAKVISYLMAASGKSGNDSFCYMDSLLHGVLSIDLLVDFSLSNYKADKSPQNARDFLAAVAALEALHKMNVAKIPKEMEEEYRDKMKEAGDYIHAAIETQGVLQRAQDSQPSK